MMIDRIIDALRSQREVDDWKIIERRVDGRELFFVKDALDMNRAKQTQKFFVTVYHDFEENGKFYRGSSEFTIHPGEIKIESLIKENVFSSKFVKNIPYPLVTSSEKRIAFTKAIPIDSINEVAYDMYSEKLENTWINSSEIFMDHVEERIVNSKGVDVSNDVSSLYVEFVTTSRFEKTEVELYWNFKFSKFEDKVIRDKVVNAMKLTKDRAHAVSTPNLKDIPVILVGESVKEFFKYHLYKVSARYIYQHLSNAKIGMDLHENNQKCDGITMWIDPFLEGSAYSVGYDEDGFPLIKIKIIDNSSVKNIWGDIRYAHYLGIEPTGHMTNFTVEPGKTSEDDLETGKYVKVLSFSDFGMDPITGDFGGEIRLGWYSDGKKTIPITGGSISGSISDLFEIVLSKETQQIDNFTGPNSLKIIGAKISGSKTST